LVAGVVGVVEGQVVVVVAAALAGDEPRVAA
jgi:hypothetical protein